MLQTMRHLTQSWLFKGLMLILIISFGIWGIGDIFRGNPSQRTVATVGSEAITADDLRKAFDQALAQMRQSLGPDLTAQQAKSFGLLDKVLDNMIAEKQVDQDIERLGIDMTEKATLDVFAAQPGFRNPDGSFKKEMLLQMAERQHMGEAEFMQKMQGVMASRELLAPFVIAGKSPSTIVDAVARARGQKRIFDIITLADNSIGDIPVPDDKTLHDYYDKNPQAFTAPETRAITIAEYSTVDAAKDITVTDDQAKKEYEAHLDQYAHPERRDVLQVVLQDESKAKQLAAAARAAGNLTSAASAIGVKIESINQMEESTVLPELGKPVFSLTPGQVSDPVKSALGWHVIQLKKIAPAGTSSFDEIKNNLRETMQKDQAGDSAAKLANQLDDELAAGHSLEDIADALKLRLIKIPALDAHGKTDAGKDPAELPDRDDVLRAAFDQAAGETSPIIDDKKGDYLVVRTDQVTPSAVRPFDKVKDKVFAAWETQEQAARAATEAEKIAADLREGKPASSVAARAGVDVRVSKPISLLGDRDPALPPSVLPQIGKMKKGEVVTTSIPGYQVILRLAEFSNPDAAAAKADQIKVSDSLSRPTMEELMGEYRQHLRDLFPPKINNDILDTIRQQGA